MVITHFSVKKFQHDRARSNQRRERNGLRFGLRLGDYRRAKSSRQRLQRNSRARIIGGLPSNNRDDLIRRAAIAKWTNTEFRQASGFGSIEKSMNIADNVVAVGAG